MQNLSGSFSFKNQAAEMWNNRNEFNHSEIESGEKPAYPHGKHFCKAENCGHCVVKYVRKAPWVCVWM